MEHFYCTDKVLEHLKPFLEGQEPAAKGVPPLLEFAHALAPVCFLALICEDTIEISSDGMAPSLNVAFQEAEKQIRFALKKQALNGFLLDDQELDQMLTSHLGGATLPFYPTLLPIQIEGQLLCSLLLGKVREKGPWTEKEKEQVSALRTMAAIAEIGQNSKRDAYLKKWISYAMIYDSDTNLYVTDIKTDEILFMNETMKQTFSLDHPEGQVCWKVLQVGQNGRCPFCPVDALLSTGEHENVSCSWRETNSVNGRIYQNYDSLLRWIDGSLVHFQKSIDVTDSLHLTQSTDVAQYNKRLQWQVYQEKIGEILAKAAAENMPVSVGVFDIDGLKEVNDTWGKEEGDFLIDTVTKAIKNCLTPEEEVFRLEDDEFVVVFPNSRERIAARKFQLIREFLQKSPQMEGKTYRADFCYGVFEPLPGNSLNLQEILQEADARMYTQKRRVHIDRAERSLQNAAPQKEQPVFKYDAEYLYDALTHSTDDYIYVSNMQDGTFHYPKAMVDEFGLPGEIVPNAATVWGNKIHPDDKKAFLESNQEIADGRTNSHCVEYRAQNRWGEWVWLRCRGHVVRDAVGEPRLFAGMIANLGKRDRIDHVTGLFDKCEFEQEITHLITNRANQAFSILVLGLDGFRHINDLYDRKFGDGVLRTIAQRIQSILPDSASVYRLDGDEFGVIVHGSPRNAESIYLGLHDRFARQQERDGKKYYCTISAGCAIYPDDASSYMDLFKYANYAMDYAKSKGRNRMEFFHREAMLHKERSLELTELLRESVENDFAGFELVFQPVVCAPDGKLWGAEALTRWRCEKYPQVSPVEFIPLLEESGLIHPVGNWILRTAAATCAKWGQEHPNFVMSINISYVQLSSPDFFDSLERMIHDTGVDPTHLVLELTESCIASNIRLLTEDFKKIRSYGIKIAMDDFGTGYSSLEILKESPANIVKVDRAFVKDIRSSTFDATFIQFIVALCRDVGIRVCLEGVELEEEYEIVREMRPDWIQGYLFGRPMSKDDFEILLNQRIE